MSAEDLREQARWNRNPAIRAVEGIVVDSRVMQVQGERSLVEVASRGACGTLHIDFLHRTCCILRNTELVPARTRPGSVPFLPSVCVSLLSGTCVLFLARGTPPWRRVGGCNLT